MPTPTPVPTPTRSPGPSLEQVIASETVAWLVMTALGVLIFVIIVRILMRTWRIILLIFAVIFLSMWLPTQCHQPDTDPTSPAPTTGAVHSHHTGLNPEAIR